MKSKLNELLDLLQSELVWHELEPAPDEAEDTHIMQNTYLCLIDWQHFNPELTEMKPYFSICYPSGDDWVEHDDVGLGGPVKYVRAWAKI